MAVRIVARMQRLVLTQSDVFVVSLLFSSVDNMPSWEAACSDEHQFCAKIKVST